MPDVYLGIEGMLFALDFKDRVKHCLGFSHCLLPHLFTLVLEEFFGLFEKKNKNIANGI